jgi:hypothetical protein
VSDQGGKIGKIGRAAGNFIPVVVGRQFHRPPIFIGGCARSGTTLLLSILSSHPGIFAIPFETKCFSARGRPSDPEAAFRIARFYRLLLSCEIPRSAYRWCEKSTKNVLTFGRIIQHFKGRVRLIHLVRDGRDVITSRSPRDASRYWVSPERWVRDVGVGMAWEGHEEVLTVRYEDLVTDLDSQLLLLGEFLDEDFTGLSRTWHERTAIRRSTAWFHDVLEPHTRSITRWRDSQYRDVVDELMAIPEAVHLLEHFGYETREAPFRA